MKEFLKNISITLLIAFSVITGLLILLFVFFAYDKYQNPTLKNLDWESYSYIGTVLLLSFTFLTYLSIRIWKNLDN
jgi:hypothetical protein